MGNNASTIQHEGSIRQWVCSSIPEGFAAQARECPAAPALLLEDGETVSFAELQTQARRLAAFLIARGMAPGEAVGVLVERSARLPQSFLAILQAGGVYVPLVADQPPARLAHMIEDAKIRRLIVLDGLEPDSLLQEALLRQAGQTEDELLIRPESERVQDFAGSLPERPPPDGNDLAAILFTSGSTGVPKGVTIRHSACVNMAMGHIEAHEIGLGDRMLLATSPGFILGFRELCIPLLCGAAYVPVARSLLDTPDRLLALMSERQVSVALFTPSYLRLLDRRIPRGLRCLLTAGERPNADDARYYARHVRHWNMHGATEACGTICMHRVDPESHGSIPSGRPFCNTKVLVLDDEGQELAPGEIGEIHVLGAGISPGYLNRPELNARAFVMTRHGRAYRTRDLGRWNAQGELETLGRNDDVVKISGQSVSLSEIETVLSRQPGVRRVIVMREKTGLVAFIECPAPDAGTHDWRARLADLLPGYMVPAQILVLEKMPINSAGKIDRQALMARAADLFAPTSHRLGDAPRGTLERDIAAVWEEILDVRPVLRDDHFFALGGTSLLAIAVCQKLQALHHPVSVQMLLSSLTVAALAERLRAVAASGTDSETDLATPEQEDFWIAAELGLPAAAQHLTQVFVLRGQVPEPAQWRRAWSALLARHPALRTGFFQDEEGRLHWRLAPLDDLPDSALPSWQRLDDSAQTQAFLARQFQTPFDLGVPFLFRVGLIHQTATRETLFWFVMHHAVVDGVSARRVAGEIQALLREEPLPKAAHGIALASEAALRYRSSPDFARDEAYWTARLDVLLQRCPEAFAATREEGISPGQTIPAAPILAEHLAPSTLGALETLARLRGIGVHAILLTLLTHEIRRRTGHAEALVGSGISIRPAGAETALGHFVNLLPVIPAGPLPGRLREALTAMQDSLTESVRHARHSATRIQRKFRQRHPDARDPARTSLFDVALTANYARQPAPAAGMEFVPLDLPGIMVLPAAGLDLSFSHEPDGNGGLRLSLTWNPAAYAEHTAKSWLAALTAWARWLAHTPGCIDQELPPLLPEEETLLAAWEHGPAVPRPDRRIHECFESLCADGAEQPALLWRAEDEIHSLSREELDRRANGIALALLRAGLKTHAVVALMSEAPVDLPAAALGIWKAGGCYLPLGVAQPAARLTTMMADTGARFLLLGKNVEPPREILHRFECVIRLEDCGASPERPDRPGTTDDAAFIIFTSGTTGVPKGVPIRHRSLLNVTLGTMTQIGLTPRDRIALVTTPTFDASLWEIALGLVGGASLVAVPPDLRDDPWALKRHYRSTRVSVAFHTPSYLHLSREMPFDGLRVLMIGGEPPRREDIPYLARGPILWNVYGPTETTVVVAGGRLDPDLPAEHPLTVGRPLENYVISLRHGDGRRVPPGEIGEIWLSGEGVAEGYLGQPELTRARFVETPEGRFYRSGDLGRWTGAGEIEILGRTDDQIKLNGQRVEPGEIEQVLHAHPDVEQAVVLVAPQPDGARILRGFVVCRPGRAPGMDELRDFLAVRLPAHMRPASLTQLPALPLNPSGKLDRAKLLASADRDVAETRRIEAPLNDLEARIAASWAELLGVPVGRHDNFFALGGDSLRAMRLAHLLSEALGYPVPARTLFAAPTLAAFAARIEARPPAAGAPMRQVHDAAPATVGETEFWTAEHAGLDTRPFIMPVFLRIDGDVPAPEAWRRAWSRLVERHEALRTRFVEDAQGVLRYRVETGIDLPIEQIRLPDQEAARQYARQRQNESLSMTRPPLWRSGIILTEAENTHFLWLAMHHAIGDGRSLSVLFDELLHLLGGGELGTPVVAPTHFAARERAYLESPESKADARYWQDTLARLPAAALAEWPLDFPRAPGISQATHRFEARLPPSVAHAMRRLAQTHRASPHALMLALLARTIQRRCGRTRMLIGTAASLTESSEEARSVAYCVNMLPLPLECRAEDSIATQLAEVRETLADVLQHSAYPFARIYREYWQCRPETRDPLRYPLFDISVTEHPRAEPRDGPLRLYRPPLREADSGYERTEHTPGQDMALLHEMDADGGMALVWQMHAGLYARDTARQWFLSLLALIRWLAADPERAANPLPPLLPEEESQLAAWERGPTRSRPALCFPQWFESVCDRPGQAGRCAIALPEGVEISYAGLDAAANVIAHALLERGLRRGETVGVLTERSPSLPAALLGIWKAAAVYLPLAADLPAQRLAFMAKDAGIRQLLALDGLALPEPLAQAVQSVVRPETLPTAFQDARAFRPGLPGHTDDIAYVLYTSGTTGQPKGTLISHRAYLNTILGAAEILGLNRDDRCLAFASPSFDVSLSDIGLPLSAGAALCPVSLELISSPSRFLAHLRKQRVSVADITPTYLGLFEEDLPDGLRILVTGGEAPLPGHVSRYADRLAYFNAYGPTEAAITSAMSRLHASCEGYASVGRPLPNTALSIRDPGDGRALPPGTPGEIWLGGVGLSAGYLRQPELEADRFLDTPTGRWYRSGDLGRWRGDGEMEILGREDEQIKLNGIRIETAEIERALETHPHVAQAVVLLDQSRGSHRKLLRAVVRPVAGIAAEQPDWRDFLSERLPGFMLPVDLTLLEQLPLTVSGKVNRKRLLEMLASRPCSITETEGALPSEGREAQVAAIWKTVLGVAEVRRTDSFFALGGSSLLAVAVADRMQRELNLEVAARELFAHPALMDFVQRAREREAPLPTQEAAEDDRATEGQRGFWTAERTGFDTRCFNIALCLRVEGVCPPPSAWEDAWETLVARHDALRIGFFEDGGGVLRCRVALPETRFQCRELPTFPEAVSALRALQQDAFSMGEPGLWRAGLFLARKTGEALFSLVLHHAIADGLSLGILIEELQTLLRGEPLGDPPPPLFTAAAREWRYLESRDAVVDADYWRARLETLAQEEEVFAEWPLDHPRTGTHHARSQAGSHYLQTRLDAATSRALKELARTQGVSLHALMLGIVSLEARRRAGRQRMLLGTAFSDRHMPDQGRMVGNFVNMLPIPCGAPENLSLSEWFAAAQANLAAAVFHGRYPFSRIHDDFRRVRRMARHPMRYPLFDIGVAQNPAAVSSADAGAFRLVSPWQAKPGEIRYESGRPPPPQDMLLVYEETAEDLLQLGWYVDGALYARHTAEDWFRGLTGWMDWLALGRPNLEAPAPLLLPAEERWLRQVTQGPARIWPHATLVAHFAHLARERGNAPAIVSDQGHTSFAEVARQAERLARGLLASGLHPGERVGVLARRSTALPVMVLAIWKAGGCHVPLAADLPPQRLAFIVEDCRPRLLIRLDGLPLPEDLTRFALPCLTPEQLEQRAGDANPDTAESLDRSHPEGEAYIIHTSGSTGTPKGVVIQHRGLLNLCLGSAETLGIRQDDRGTLMFSPAFDGWFSDLLLAWGAGAAVVPITREEMDDIPSMRDKLERHQVTMTCMPPSYLRLFAGQLPAGIRLLMTVGEPPIGEDIRHYAPRLAYCNGYGPTENTVATTIGRLAAEEEHPTAGGPLANVSVQIVDARGKPLPPGMSGEIWLGGVGLAAGYLNRPDLTDAAFIETPEGRRYRSGDQGRWTADGRLHIRGRVDTQVKLRGQRVEPGEIEHRLSACPGVTQAVAVLEYREDGTPTLWAFVTAEATAKLPSQREWKRLLARHLPEYMIPAGIFRVDSIPLAIQGKVDRAALLRQRQDRLPDDTDPLENSREAPLPGTETEIAQIWAELLECPDIRRGDDFFARGGDSLRAIAVINRLRARYFCRVNDLYENPALRDFAHVCRPRAERLLADIAQCPSRDQSPSGETIQADRIAPCVTAYEARWAASGQPGPLAPWRHVLLTGATGYLGSYLLQALLQIPDIRVSVLARGSTGNTAQTRLRETLDAYFGRPAAAALLASPRLTVWEGDLRLPDQGLDPAVRQTLAQDLDALIHCAANVRHFGHYADFYADNVKATQHLLELAGQARAAFHFISTLSVAGRHRPVGDAALFTEYDPPPEHDDENYYVRSKQQAERLAFVARSRLENVCIHRVGNIAFASQGSVLQRQIEKNAFFRQILDFLRLGVVPVDLRAAFSHVDLVAHAILALARDTTLANETHHIETDRPERLADLLCPLFPQLEACDNVNLLERLAAASKNPALEAACIETLENLGLSAGRVEPLRILSGRTQSWLGQRGFHWPGIPAGGLMALADQAAHALRIRQQMERKTLCLNTMKISVSGLRALRSILFPKRTSRPV